MLSNLKLLLFASLLLTFCSFSTVSASPIEITAGTIRPFGTTFDVHGRNIFILSGLEFHFSGDQFSVNGGNGSSSPLGSINTCGNDCEKGDIVGVRGTISSGAIQRNGNGSGRFTYQGVEYRVLQATFSFSGVDTTLPDFINLADPRFDINVQSIPFNMKGTLLLDSLSTNMPDFTVEIFGKGLADLDYVSGEGSASITSNDKAFLGKIVYKFGATPEPVPEPGTLLLLATGLIGIGGYVKRKRKS